jgi:hypothetical protein
MISPLREYDYAIKEARVYTSGLPHGAQPKLP